MKTCTACGKNLQNSSDEYGEAKYPICQHCWLNGYPPELVKTYRDLQHEFITVTEKSNRLIQDYLDSVSPDFFGIIEYPLSLQIEVKKLEQEARAIEDKLEDYEEKFPLMIGSDL